MNVFYLDKDPVKCAEYHCDKHVVKMLVEYAQIMCTNHRLVDGIEYKGRSVNGRLVRRYFHPDPYMNIELYKACHMHHPSTVWARTSTQNYLWLYEMWSALALEYTHRYEKFHASYEGLNEILMLPPKGVPDVGFTEPTPAMSQFPQCIVKGDSITSYRNYYKEAKRDFAKWTNRDVPEWWGE